MCPRSWIPSACDSIFATRVFIVLLPWVISIITYKKLGFLSYFIDWERPWVRIFEIEAVPEKTDIRSRKEAGIFPRGWRRDRKPVQGIVSWASGQARCSCQLKEGDSNEHHHHSYLFECLLCSGIMPSAFYALSHLTLIKAFIKPVL